MARGRAPEGDGYALDLLGSSRVPVSARVLVGGEERELSLLAPRRREARALEQLSEAAASGGRAFVDALYACAALLLSRNSQGVEVSADEAAESLSVADCERLVLAVRHAMDEEAASLGKA